MAIVLLAGDLAVSPPCMAAGDVHPPAQLDSAALFQVVGTMFGIDPALLIAIAAVESHTDSSAVSPAGAQGLMQLIPGTARRFRVSDPFDPIDNALGAARYLDYLRRQQLSTAGSDASLAEVLAAYNAGEQAVAKYGGVPPYRETQRYVRQVLTVYLLEALISRPELKIDRRLPADQFKGASSPRVASVSPRSKTPRHPAAPSVKAPDVFEQLARIRRERIQRLRSDPFASSSPASSR